MKKILQIIIISLFTGFSFYYTDKIIEMFKEKDPIMTMIEDASKKNEIEPVNGILSEHSMLVGKSGEVVDKETSYEKMKKLDEFNENLLEYTKVKPSITKEENLDKLITGSSTNDKEISLVFSLENLNHLEEIAYILNETNTPATFFMDGNLIENNLLKLKSIFNSNIKVGFLGYKNNYKAAGFRYTNGLVTNNLPYSNYCIYRNPIFLESCSSFKVNTIIPTLIEKNLYNYMKQNKKEGLIYEIKDTNLNIRELNSTIIYLKQKGYKVKSIDKLLEE